MRSPLRLRNFTLLICVILCIVLFTLRRNVHSDSKNIPVEGILFSDAEFAVAHKGNAEKGTYNPPRLSNDQCYQVSPLACMFDSKISPGCYMINNIEAVVPLGLIKAQYEVFGGVRRGSSTLYVHHADVEIPSTIPDQHEPTGRYMFFHKYNVESRPHVKLVIADEGVPISSQWDPRGYPYAIQIAQFGLSHYTKMLDLKRSIQATTVEHNRLNLVDLDLKNAIVQGFHVHVQEPQNWEQGADGSIRFFSSSSVDVAKPSLTVQLTLNSTWRYFVLSGQQWHEGSSVAVRVLWSDAFENDRFRSSESVSDENSHDRIKSFDLVYACQSASDHNKPYLSVSLKQNTATFWMPHCVHRPRTNKTSPFRLRLARDLFSDLFKAFGATKLGLSRFYPRRSRKDQMGWPEESDIARHQIHVHSIRLSAGSGGPQGGGLIDELRLGVSHKDLSGDQRMEGNIRTELLFHEYRFLAASSWFQRNQRSDGTWAIPVVRNFRGRVPIKPGWPSAMGQGHGLSLLVRAYNYTGDYGYFNSAQSALLVYSLSVSQRGVRSLFLNQPSLPWYEEYPTDPGNFVLNGFVYALFGLYDLAQVESRTKSLPKSNAADLLDSGLTTLSSLLPLFDSGGGSFYDLRHVMQPSGGQTVASHTSRTSDSGPILRLDLGPNRARWDYHAVHIRQLRILSVIDNYSIRAEQWLITANRWTSYMTGFRSPHN
ncbi:D-glucuronyl C5-epimerase [Fasciola hepatica]|uniref:D-glucuronyl C5-epimerase n=1 Tax=Fasciola hepatica TaxID=6192 RepID=A0A4E0RUN1_FASHE|nr:D-glucuronyl C5-epimerase [Fasciola hepatica]